MSAARARHFNAHPPVRRPGQFFAANQQRLIIELKIAGRHRPGKFAHPLLDSRHIAA
ncbi:Uncharacterised protein [Salmonella enterica subsp. enterica serovar Bovismorbificans]|uniref:Uncharacterized protein n=1 Tax=Salmonella enterica subsp. enterica serovar Bovismorbificans TaxID=58097 RepID=A0A655EB31_SALET|nr:Uncharacterised protein [Salmonella enterica subsp. enterica serovar Bovismorbificans]